MQFEAAGTFKPCGDSGLPKSELLAPCCSWSPQDSVSFPSGNKGCVAATRAFNTSRCPLVSLSCTLERSWQLYAASWCFIPKLLGSCHLAGHHPFELARKYGIPLHLLLTSNEAWEVSQRRTHTCSLLEEHRCYRESPHIQVQNRLWQGASWTNNTLKVEQLQSSAGLNTLKRQPRKSLSPWQRTEKLVPILHAAGWLSRP